MVKRDDGYFRSTFKGQHTVTQGDPLSPTIFNVVIDTILQHWVTMVSAMEGTVEPDTEGFRRYVQRMAEYFYAENGLFVSTRANWLHQFFNVLTELFDWVGLHTNVGNTVSMAYQSCREIGSPCRGLCPKDYGRGYYLPGEAPTAGPLPRVRCRPGGGFIGDPSSGTTWDGIGSPRSSMW